MKNDYEFLSFYFIDEQKEYLNRSIKSLMELSVPYIINSIQGVGNNEL